MLGNERHNYNIIFDEIKMRLLLYVKKLIFRDLFIKVSLFALKKDVISISKNHQLRYKIVHQTIYHDNEIIICVCDEATHIKRN